MLKCAAINTKEFYLPVAQRRATLPVRL